jgi:molybdate transport system regulatory protein
MVRLTIRIDFAPGQALGPGKVSLLEQIEETGSIRGAAAVLKMSYRRAWLLVQATEKTFGAPLIVAATGGRKGGGASLTALGKKVIRLYRAVERRAEKGASKEILRLEHSRYSKAKKPGKLPRK